MSTYHIRLPSGEQATVEIPVPIHFSRPVWDEEARPLLIAHVRERVAAALEPHIKPRGPRRDVRRDEQGRIAQVIDQPADPPAREMAARLGREVAERFVDEVDWS